MASILFVVSVSMNHTVQYAGYSYSVSPALRRAAALGMGEGGGGSWVSNGNIKKLYYY